MKIFVQEDDNSPYFIKGHKYLIKDNTAIDLTLLYKHDKEFRCNYPKRNSAANLIWPNVEIPFIPGDYYDADRKEKK